MMNTDEQILGPALAAGGIDVNAPVAQSEYVPTYKAFKDAKVPVSKHAGKLWQSRRDQAVTKRKSTRMEDAWVEALDYFMNDQIDNRDVGTEGKRSRNRRQGAKQTSLFTTTENVVFANTKQLVPTLYAKNPQIEITLRNTNTDNELLKRQVLTLERAVNASFNKEDCPGVSLKRKAKRAVVLALLTNRAYAAVDYTQREASSESAQKDLETILTEYQNAKSIDEIRIAEGKLQALENKTDLLLPPGPTVNILSPMDVLVDTIGEENDAIQWMMYNRMIPTSLILALYAEKNEKDEYASIYEPTHIMRATSGNEDSFDETINNFSLFARGQTDYKQYGYNDEVSFKKSQLTKCWYVFDRTSRRVMLFNDKDWSWPIWVWDDPLHLEGFFNLFPLEFYTNPLGGDAKGEVSYYLDQQDAINEIESQVDIARNQAVHNLLYDDKIPRDTIEAILKGDERAAKGVKVPEGTKLSDMIQSVISPALQHPELFDKQRYYQAIERISSVSAAMSGQQYKTNTTNQAIANYQQSASVALDEKIDALEDWLGKIGWAIAQCMLQFMQAAEVSALVGYDVSDHWQNYSPEEIQSLFACTCVGGSTKKPTADAKKQEAVQVGQVLGQFVQATPAALLIVLKLFENAFDELIIKDEDWKLIEQSVVQKMQNDQVQAQGQLAKQQQAASGEGSQQPQGNDELINQLEQLIDHMPSQAKQALGQALAQGVPIKVALPQIIEMLKGSVQPQPQQQQPQ